MSALTINYFVNPIHKFWLRIEKFLTIVGYSRAAAELIRQGRYDLAKKIMLEQTELENK